MDWFIIIGLIIIYYCWNAGINVNNIKDTFFGLLLFYFTYLNYNEESMTVKIIKRILSNSPFF